MSLSCQMGSCVSSLGLGSLFLGLPFRDNFRFRGTPFKLQAGPHQAAMYRALSFAIFVVVCLGTHVLSQSVTGKATYYNPDGGTGACGTTISNSDMEAALGWEPKIIVSLR